MHLTRSTWASLAGTRALDDACEQALRTEGYFLLEEVFDPRRVRAMHDAVSRLLEAHVAEAAENRGRNRYNLPVPAQAPFVDAETALNRLWFPLLQRVLGSDLVLDYLGADTPLQGSDHQAAHADAHPLFPGRHDVLPVHNVVVNVLLTEFSWDNGPLEIWPDGSHESDPAAAGSGRPGEPLQLIAPAGSVVVRDARMWHRGSPNRTPLARPMLALAYQRSWYRFDVGHPPVEVAADTYRDWPAELQRLFRFARVPGGGNVPVIHDTFTEHTAVAPTAAPV